MRMRSLTGSGGNGRDDQGQIGQCSRIGRRRRRVR